MHTVVLAGGCTLTACLVVCVVAREIHDRGKLFGWQW